MENFEKTLEKYAEVIVKVGLNLQEGQRLHISADTNTAVLTKQVAAKAYQNGCPLVTVLWTDEDLRKIRHQYAPRDSFEEFPAWVTDGQLRDAKRGDAYLSVTGRDPELLAGQDPDLVALELKTIAKHFKPVSDYVTNGGNQWTVVCPPTPKWASKVFPDAGSPEKAEEKLWETLFKLCRLENDDPVAVWQNHLEDLERRRAYLTEKQFVTLHFHGAGTDLKVGMPDKRIWKGGRSETNSGAIYTPNIPTEEVFCMPHKYKVDGIVQASKPLNYHGNLIENFNLTFSKGRVVDFKAEHGEDALRKMLEADEGASYLGEVALVPHKSPISESGLIFFNTLYDENAACHVALGSAYKENIEGGNEMSAEEAEATGVNDSLIHVDFMIGSDQVDVDGITPDGSVIPLIKNGEWAFSA